MSRGQNEKYHKEKYHKEKHLEFIEGVIERLARNSLSCKTWALTLFSALSAVFLNASKNSCDKYNIRIFFVAVVIMLFIFWCLDAWYLKMERMYRSLYDAVCAEDSPKKPYDMSIDYFKGGKNRMINTIFSLSVCPVYCPLIIFLLFVFYLCFIGSSHA